MEREIFPRSIDVNPTSGCQLQCPFCWGPHHETPDTLTTQDWIDTIRFFTEGGTDAIVFTGGEPLLRKDIVDLIRFSKGMGMRVTLSTNTILLPTIEEISPLVDEIGIPMDGSTEEKNLLMREGKINSFRYQIDALSKVKKSYPNIDVTVRTVMSKVNIDDLPQIGELLTQYVGSFDRWKIYQFSPFSYGDVNKERYTIFYQDYMAMCNKLMAKYPQHCVSGQSSSLGHGRYVFVGSQGDIYGVGDSDNYLAIGNFLSTDPSDIEVNLKRVFEPEKNSRHAHLVNNHSQKIGVRKALNNL